MALNVRTAKSSMYSIPSLNAQNGLRPLTDEAFNLQTIKLQLLASVWDLRPIYLWRKWYRAKAFRSRKTVTSDEGRVMSKNEDSRSEVHQ